jgi:3-oxoacyl-(acyl-carrier-protein) synthase
MRRAVITGVGAVCAFGVGLDALFDGLQSGVSRIGPIASFDARAFDTQVACEVTAEPLDRAWVRSIIGDLGAAEAMLSAPAPGATANACSLCWLRLKRGAWRVMRNRMPRW